jgi:hypothetical protein
MSIASAPDPAAAPRSYGPSLLDSVDPAPHDAVFVLDPWRDVHLDNVRPARELRVAAFLRRWRGFQFGSLHPARVDESAGFRRDARTVDCQPLGCASQIAKAVVTGRQRQLPVQRGCCPPVASMCLRYSSGPPCPAGKNKSCSASRTIWRRRPSALRPCEPIGDESCRRVAEHPLVRKTFGRFSGAGAE